MADQEEFKFAPVIEEIFPCVLLYPGYFHVKGNGLNAVFRIYGDAGMDEMILRILNIKKDLSDSLKGFEKSYVPFVILYCAVILSFIRKCAPYAKCSQMVCSALEYHAYGKNAITVRYWIETFSIEKGQSFQLEKSENTSFWAKFILRYGAAIIIMHRSMRDGRPAIHQNILDAFTVMAELLGVEHKTNYQELVARSR